MRIDILTIFPEMFEPALAVSIPGRARDAGLLSWHTTDIRDFATDKHSKVDDRPFGGGPGMVMYCQPVWDAHQHALSHDPRPARTLLTSPQGVPLTQPLVEELAQEERLILIAGHYEGLDERVIERIDPLEVSVGDYVLSGGELPAMLIIDALARLQPGALGHADSAAEDSFSIAPSDGRRLLDCPHYTRPREWEGQSVPDVLLSGDHARIAAWRLQQRLERTKARRPDLISGSEDSSHPA